MYDAIVVGARCAGSPTAMLLARRGYRVLLVDRATFPSDIMSTHYIHQAGVAHLKRWGLMDQVAASNCPPIRRGMFDFGPIILSGFGPPVDGAAEAYGPRRKVLDKLLVDAAVAAGAELREGFAVQEIVMDGDRVTGIRGRDRGGATVTEQARIVVGADGLHSLVARAVQAPVYHERPALTCGYYSYWSGVPHEGFELYPREGVAVIVIPTNDGQLCIAVQWWHRDFDRVRSDIEGHFNQALEIAPGLVERMAGGRREERFVGTADLPNFFRTPHGPGWSLVGDAGYHKDPHTGQGITDAFRDAELLAEAIDAGLSGREPLAEALAGYEQRRDEAAMPAYDLTCQLAALEPPPPEMRELFAALQANQAETNRFFGTLAGSVPIPEFFAPENTRRIVESAGTAERVGT